MSIRLSDLMLETNTHHANIEMGKSIGFAEGSKETLRRVIERVVESRQGMTPRDPPDDVSRRLMDLDREALERLFDRLLKVSAAEIPSLFDE